MCFVNLEMPYKCVPQGLLLCRAQGSLVQAIQSVFDKSESQTRCSLLLVSDPVCNICGQELKVQLG